MRPDGALKLMTITAATLRTLRARAPLTAKISATPELALRSRNAMAGAGGTLSLLLLAASSQGQVVAAADPAAAGRPKVPAPIVADTQSCTALKDALRSAGTLTIIPEQRSWGETFYG